MKKLIVIILAIILVVLVIAFSKKANADEDKGFDAQCQVDCINMGYSWALCQKRCSY